MILGMSLNREEKRKRGYEGKGNEERVVGDWRK